MRNIITGSRLNILNNCPGMLTQPWVSGESGRDAQRGTRIHEGIVSRYRGEPTMLEFDEERNVASAVTWLRQQPFSQIQFEVAYSMSRDGTVRRILTAEHRDYGELTEGEVPGTLDVVAVREGGRHVIIDWKTGNEVESPAENWQLLLGGLCRSRFYDLDEVELGIAYTRGDYVWYDSAVVPRLTLDLFERQLRERMDGDNSGDLRAGKHCKYCPAAMGCPKQQQALAKAPLPTELAESDDFVWTTEAPGTTLPDGRVVPANNDVQMLLRLPAVGKALEAAEKAIKARAGAAGGIDLGNGKVYRQGTRQMPRFVRSKAEELLGPERYAECVTKREELYFGVFNKK
jgi:hypothetical protein